MTALLGTLKFAAVVFFYAGVWFLRRGAAMTRESLFAVDFGGRRG